MPQQEKNDSTDLSLQLSVDPTVARHTISPLIYGINVFEMADNDFAELNQAIRPSVVRWGGNKTTRYNWENDFTNTGSDYYYENVPVDNPDRSQLPNNSAADRFVQRNKTAGIESLITVPLIGWVAKETSLMPPYTCGFGATQYKKEYNHQPPQKADPFNSECGNGIRRDTSLPITGNDPADTSIPVGPDFVRRWVAHLVERFSNASDGGVHFYNLDNEPGVWAETHRDVFPGYLSYEELLQRTIDYATAIRQADPSAQILGPVQDGWQRYFYSSYRTCPEQPSDPDCIIHNTRAEKNRQEKDNEAFVAWYLAQLHAHDQETGQRTIDYFDLHYYPQAEGIALSSAGDNMTQALRLRSVRSLWDASYVDESWIKNTEGGNTAVQLIPRMHDWVNQHYPGLKLAISEYNWGALDEMNGALAQADVLGIFGREDVGLATLWAPPTADQPGAFAFRMYRNYDGQGSTFGDVSISAISEDQEKLAIYSAQRSSDNALTLMIINKSNTELSAQISLGGFVGGQNAQHYRYSAANPRSIEQLTDLPISNGAINSVFEASSINLLIIAV